MTHLGTVRQLHVESYAAAVRRRHSEVYANNEITLGDNPIPAL